MSPGPKCGDVAGGLSCLLCFAFYMPFSTLYSAMSRETVIEGERWADQQWELVECTVRDSGLEYRGNCWFAESVSCPPSTCSSESNLDWYREVTSKPTAHEESLSRRLRCTNQWLTWMSVALPGRTDAVCAYRYGMSEFEDLVTNDYYYIGPTPGSSRKCWVAVGNPCIVATRDPEEVVGMRQGIGEYAFYSFWVTMPLTLVTWCCLAGFFVRCCCASGVSTRDSAYLGGAAAENLHRLDYFDNRIALPPGHWSQWDVEQIDEAAGVLFHYYDKDGSGHLDVNEMVQIMAVLGVHNRHLVKRTMVQLDHDESGLIDEAEFGDLCRQVFWNGSQTLVRREFDRQVDIVGARAASVSGLAKNRPLLILECIIYLAAVAVVSYAYVTYGHLSCDSRFGRYLLGAGFMVSLELLFLLTLSCVVRVVGETLLQGTLMIIHCIGLIYATAGLIMQICSQVCDPDLRSWSLGTVLMLMATSLYVLVPGVVGLISAYIAVKRGTSLSSLTIDDDPDSDSSYEEVPLS